MTAKYTFWLEYEAGEIDPELHDFTDEFYDFTNTVEADLQRAIEEVAARHGVKITKKLEWEDETGEEE